MKYISLVFFSLIIFSCNNNDKAPKDPVANDSGLQKTDSAAEEKLLKNAVQQYPDSTVLLQNLLGFYLKSADYNAAASAIDNAVKRDSTNPDLWDMRSVVYVTKQDTAQGILSLQKAIDLYPLPEYIISLGALYAETKNPKALEMADALLIGNKARAEKEAYFIKGLYYNNSNQKEKAIASFDQSLSADAYFMDAYVQKALALYDLGKYEPAAAVLRRAVTLQNNFAEGYFHLGQCYEKLNRKADAAEQYKKALLYDPNYEEAGEALDNLKM